MEHAVPEQFWVDKSQCRYTDEQGQIQNPTMADCAQGVSAVKAIAIAQAEGQRIYTINQSNTATALPKLPVGGTVGQEIQSAIQAGKEVTFHERGINAHGFSGYGYVITDPETGGGAYLIEGKGNGGILIAVGVLMILLAIAPLFYGVGVAFLISPAFLTAFAGLLGAGIGYILAGYGYLTKNNTLIAFGYSVVAGGLGLVAVSPWLQVVAFLVGAFVGSPLPFINFL
jgi:hypothetical protein